MAGDFFIFSLRWTKEDYATWWRPKNSGYTSVITEAGRYSAETVAAAPDYYDNGHTTIAIPCAEVEAAAQLVVFDYAFRKLVERIIGWLAVAAGNSFAVLVGTAWFDSRGGFHWRGE